MLDKILQTQSKKGVGINAKQVAKIPLNDWYTRTQQLQTLGIDPAIYTDKTKLWNTYGRYITVMTRCVRDAAGMLKTDYASVLIAAKYANSMRGCPYTERVLLNTTLYAMGSADLYGKIQQLTAATQAGRGLYYPSFKQAGELMIAKDGNMLPTMTLMAYLTKPEGTVAHIISAYDAIKPAYLSSLIGLSDKKIAYLKSQGKTPIFMHSIPEIWELKLAPQIFNFEFGMIDRNLISVINQYKEGKLLKYREGLRGRKPITENPYMERIYPEQKALLNKRIEMFITEAAQANFQDRYNIYYATPYYIAVCISPSDRVLFKPIFDKIFARQLFEVKTTTLANGDFL